MIAALCATLLLLSWYYGTFSTPLNAYTEEAGNSGINMVPASPYQKPGMTISEGSVSSLTKGNLDFVNVGTENTQHQDHADKDAASVEDVDSAPQLQVGRAAKAGYLEQVLDNSQHSPATLADGEDDLDDPFDTDVKSEELQHQDPAIKKQPPNEMTETNSRQAGPNLDPETEKGAKISVGELPKEQKQLETESVEHLSLEEKGGALPDVVHRPLEESVLGMVLQGWEDEWVASATFNRRLWGTLEEPKIDFVYLCMLQMIHN